MGLNAREPISGLEFDCQLTFPIYGIFRTAYMSRTIQPRLVVVVSSVTGSGFADYVYGGRG